MVREPAKPGVESRRSSRAIFWIIGVIGALVLIYAVFQGVVRGGGEALGVRGAAPGDQNASPIDTGGG